MSKFGVYKKLYNQGLLDEETFARLDEKLASEIALGKSKKNDKINELRLEVELLKSGLLFS